MVRRSPRANLLFMLGCILIIMSFVSGFSTYQSDSNAVSSIDYRCAGQYMGGNDTCHANGKNYTAAEWMSYKNQDVQDRQNNAFWNALKNFGIFFGFGVLLILIGIFAFFTSTPYYRR